MMKNNLFLTTIVFFCFLTNVYAENGHVDLKYLSENYSSFGQTQNLSGFERYLCNSLLYLVRAERLELPTFRFEV